ncbi:MAG: tripartite tricarboxylate transporter TctB family protein [Alphaproteobacteria bacterium]|nr:MAG: tripartite tricarboxylate transporter TctB family protein [Alphaproteobacteria bacterium]
MNGLNRDSWIALFLLLFTGFMFWASFDIREPDYGVLPPSAWPRVILAALAILSFIYLIQSLRSGAAGEEGGEEGEPETLRDYLVYWRNPILCFVLFAGYLILLPILGMLLDGILFVFLLQCVLGGWQPRQLLLHAAVAVIAVGGMWSIFTFGLHVILPPGEILPRI